jgi:hypothetical protein
MLYLHETHQIAGGKTREFAEAVRTRWRPLVEERNEARLLWYWGCWEIPRRCRGC